MPRRARIALAGVPLHIIQRGNKRHACFFSADDYRFYLDHLGPVLIQSIGCVVAKSVDRKTRDAAKGRSLGKECNAAAGAFGHNPQGTGLSGRMAALRRLAVE